MVEVMSDKMQMQRYCVIVNEVGEKNRVGKGEGLAKHWRAADWRQLNLDLPQVPARSLQDKPKRHKRPPLGLELGQFLTLDCV
jgi:hypothetical protein